MKAVLSMAAVAALCALCATASAQDPAQTDPVHFKVQLDNPSVRVLHVKVEPNTKVKVHDMADAVVVPLADYTSVLQRKNGETTTVERKKGKAVWLSGGMREIQSGAQPIDALLIEIKKPEASQ
jgi:hypothetical protein